MGPKKEKAPKAEAPKEKKAPKPAEHPPYAEMVVAAIKSLKERGGSSRQAILKYIQANYKVNDQAPLRLKNALRKMSEVGKVVHAKGQGASGSFKLPKPEAKPKAEKKEKKPTGKEKKK